MTKCEEYKQLFIGTDTYNCETCFHRFSCENSWDSSKYCAYWYHPDSEIQGLAYINSKKEEEMPLFVG